MRPQTLAAMVGILCALQLAGCGNNDQDNQSPAGSAGASADVTPLAGAAPAAASVPASAPAPGSAAPAPTTSAQADFAALLAAMNGHATAVANLGALATVDPSAVTLVNVADMVGGNNMTPYLDALAIADAAGVQAAISGNAVLASTVTSRGVDVSDVIAIDVTAAGAVTVYYVAD